MDTSKKITSYEDACKVLNIQPINEEVFNAFPKEDQRSMLAYHKLTVITRALNNGWKPNWDDQNEWKYYPLFRYVNAGLSYAYTHITRLRIRLRVSALGFAFPRPRSRNTQPNTLRTCTVTIIALLRKTEKRNKRKAAKKNPKATF